jgi:hypothetical protein
MNTAPLERAIRSQAEALRRADEIALLRVAQERKAKTQRWQRLLQTASVFSTVKR